MKLVQFSVTNFRSITSAHKIAISDTTILIGRNNEGKSNILTALSFAMTSLLEHAVQEKRRIALPRKIYRSRHRRYEKVYDWNRDFPVAFQSRKSNKQSIFRIEFELDDNEIQLFKEEIKSSLNGTLPLEIRIGENNIPAIQVPKKGRGNKTLNAKSGKVAAFIAKRIFFNYIPAVRTDKEALSVINDMVHSELRILEEDDKYIEALNVISDLQKPILKELAKRIKEPLSEFLPEIKTVKIDVDDYDKRSFYRMDLNVIIDDGTPTNIEYKGDGVKSLAALGLLKNKSLGSGASIIAIEEPESHLHPAAIHQISDIINALSEKNQVIITTHNPLFVDRFNIKTNIIVEKGKASPAKNVQQIRGLLGVKASDNLLSSSYTLVVEGEEDKVALIALLPVLSEKISKAIKSNLLVIDPIGGAGNLPYKLSLIKNSLCVYHVLLDHDDAGKSAFEKAEGENLISIKNCTYTTCKGMNSAEFEDTIDPSIYKEEIFSSYGVDLNVSQFRGNRKWSERVKDAFMNQGKIWDSKLEGLVKKTVSECIEKKPKTALFEHKRNSIDSLVKSLEEMIKD